MEITLSRVIDAARQRRAAVTAEAAGYVVLLLVQQVAGCPCPVTADLVLLTAAGEVRVEPGPAAAAREVEVELRRLLAALLALSQSAPPALHAAGERGAVGDLAALQSELLAALIPLNHAAAGRALARLYRETLRAPRAVLASNEASPLPSSVAASPLPSSVTASPLPSSVAASPLPSSVAASPLPSSVAASPLPSSVAASPLPSSVAASPLPSSVAVSQRTPVAAAVRTPAPVVAAAVPTPLPLAAAVRAPAPAAPLVRAPVELEIDVDLDVDVALAAEEEPQPLVLTPPQPLGQVLEPVGHLGDEEYSPTFAAASAAPDEDLEPSAQRSDLRELLHGFLAHTRCEERMAADLRRMIGLEPGRGLSGRGADLGR